MDQIFTVIVLILSVIAHEVAHGYAASALGDPTAKLAGRLTLNPLPHIDLFGSVLIPAFLVFTHSSILFGWAKPVPYNPYNLKSQRWGEAIVAVAGSATNLLLAVVFAVITRLLVADGMDTTANLTALISFINLFLGLFNLIPFPPLDGYTFLRGILPYRLSYVFQSFENQIRSLGAGGIFLVLIVFSFVLADPFYYLVSKIFTALVGM